MKIHFIAIGGAAMHNLAIALHRKGYEVTGSDDEIFDPSRSRLSKHGLLPEKWGWHPGKIHENLDAVILGMHARDDNPELAKARELGIKIYSFPEYLYEQTKNKKRFVIGGSHGKTSITSMIIHVLKDNNILFDYMVGSLIEGFETMVGLHEDSRIAVFEGDEYLSSALDKRPKFHLYQPDVGLISGIAWDHINVFPTFENYVEQFRIFAGLIPAKGSLIYFQDDKHAAGIASEISQKVEKVPYQTHPHLVKEGVCYLETPDGWVETGVFGTHNMQNISAAKAICLRAGVTESNFYRSISSFKGAAKRLQLVKTSGNNLLYVDFAHSPSKLKATIQAVKEQFPGKNLVACMELHTFSSLTKEFLKQYKSTMVNAEIPVVYFNPDTLKHKKLPQVKISEVKNAFHDERLQVFTSKAQLETFLSSRRWDNTVFLMMSSGNFSGLDFHQII